MKPWIVFRIGYLITGNTQGLGEKPHRTLRRVLGFQLLALLRVELFMFVSIKPEQQLMASTFLPVKVSGMKFLRRQVKR